MRLFARLLVLVPLSRPLLQQRLGDQLEEALFLGLGLALLVQANRVLHVAHFILRVGAPQSLVVLGLGVLLGAADLLVLHFVQSRVLREQVVQQLLELVVLADVRSLETLQVAFLLRVAHVQLFLG